MFYHDYTRTITSIQSTIAVAKVKHSISRFKHPKLTDDELMNGTRLGFDSWADTSCAGKHAFVESFVEGKTVNAVGFSHSLGKLENLPIANVVYAYDFSDGRTVLIENFNAIYLGESMEDSLVNPIQCEDNGVHIDMRPKRFYPQLEDDCQQILFEDGTIIPLEFDAKMVRFRYFRLRNKYLVDCIWERMCCWICKFNSSTEEVSLASLTRALSKYSFLKESTTVC